MGLKSFFSKSLDIISAPLSQPKILLSQGIGAASRAVAAERKAISSGRSSGFKTIGRTVRSTAVIAGLTVGGSAAFAAGRAGTLVPVLSKAAQKAAILASRTVIPKTLRGKIIGGSAALLGAGVLKGSPKSRKAVGGAIKDLPKKPGKIVAFGEKVGKVIEGETKFNKGNVVEGLKTAGIVGGVVAAGALIIPKVAAKIGEDKPIEAVAPTLFTEPEASKQLIPDKAVGIPGQPQPAETVTVSPTRKPSKRRRAKKTPSVRQSVRVNIINAPTNKNYINRKIMVNSWD